MECDGRLRIRVVPCLATGWEAKHKSRSDFAEKSKRKYSEYSQSGRQREKDEIVGSAGDASNCRLSEELIVLKLTKGYLTSHFSLAGS